MSTHRFLLLFMFSFLALGTATLGATFTTSATPSTINATTSTLVNITVSNTDALNISKVVITLPQYFTCTSPLATNASWSSSGCNSAPTSNSTITWVANVTPGQANYFSFYTSASVIGAWNINVTANDTAGTLTSNNVAITVNDVTAPQYSSNTTSPATPTAYVNGRSYTFSTYWSDGINISSVIFYWNGATNYTANTAPAITNSSGTYSITLSNLAAGNYTYYWIANDTTGNTNTSNTFVYNITAAANNITQTFNGFKGNTVATNASSSTIIVNGNGTLTLYQNGTQVASNASCPAACYLSYTFTPSTVTGLYNFTSTAAGNANYTSITASFYPFIIPSYTMTNDAPSTYTTGGTAFTLNFTASPGVTAKLETDYSGTMTNYSMTQSSNTFSYAIALPAGNYGWKVYLSQGTYTYNLTNGNITINKAVPTLNMNNTLWSITYGVITNVSCSSPQTQVTPHLYRNGVSVTNGDWQTLAAGSYIYLCNSTTTTNYSAAAVSNTLVVSAATTYAMQMLQAPAIVNVLQNSSNTTIVVVKNIGTEAQAISLSISGINASIWSVNSSATITPNYNASFLVAFSSLSTASGEYAGTWVATGKNGTVNSSFTLRVMPSTSTISGINATFAAYQLQYNDFATQINQSKTQGLNTTLAEAKLSQLKSQIDSMRAYIEQGDYFNAASTSTSIISKISEVKTEMDKLKPPLIPINWPLYAIIGGIAIAVIFVIYLFLPSKHVQTPMQPVKEKEENG